MSKYFSDCCKDCKERWVDYESNPARTCHETCKRWKEARAAKDQENENRRKCNDTYKKNVITKNNIRTKSLLATTRRIK